MPAKRGAVESCNLKERPCLARASVAAPPVARCAPRRVLCPCETAAAASGALAGAKGGLDAAVWAIAADKKVTKLWAWGGNGNDVMSAVFASLGQTRAFGTTLADKQSLSQWFEAVVSPAKASGDDYNPCTTDACGAKTGCGHTPVKNGTKCGTSQMCTAGVCK